MIRIFGDRDSEVLNFTGKGNEELLAENKEFYDGALPAGNSVALLNIAKLARITGDGKLQKRAERMAGQIMAEADNYLPGYTMFMVGVDFILGPTADIVVAGEPSSAGYLATTKAISQEFYPNKIMILHPPSQAGREIEGIAPHTKDKNMIGGRTTVYLCIDNTCNEPVTDPEKLIEILKGFPGDN